MRKIISIKPIEDFMLSVKFDNGVEKKFDFKSYFKFPVFSILQNQNIFQEVSNKGYYIEWQNHEIDLSADTL